MTSKEALYLLMTNQKKVRDNFRFIDLNTHEKVSIEECYDTVIKDLEVLEILKNYSYSHDNFTLFIALESMKFDELVKVKDWLENEKEN